MKKLQRMTGLVLVLLCLAGVAWAAGSPSLYIQKVLQGSEGTIEAVVYTTAEGNLSPEDFQIKIGGQAASAAGVRSYTRTPGYATSYLIVIDTPNAMTNRNLAAMKGALSGFAEQIGAEDNVGLLRVGEVPSAETLSSDKAAVAERIGEIAKQNKPATLNATIVEALAFLETTTQAKERKVLIVASTGEKRDEAGATQGELEERAAASSVMIYTLAMMESNKDQGKNQQANTFGAIARRSRGGMDIIALDGQAKAEGIQSQLVDNERRIFVLPIQAEGAAAGMTLTIALQEADRLLTDETVLDAALTFSDPTTPSLPGDTDETAEEEETDEPEGIGKETIPPVPDTLKLMLIGASGVLVILLVVLVLVTRRKKRSKDLSITQIGEDSLEDGQDHMAETEVISTPVNEAKVYVTFTPIGKSNMEATSFYMADSLVIGRNSSAAQLVINDDPKVSGRHAMLSYANKVMRIEDLRSTNGTRVNDKDVTAPAALKENDIITVGRTSLRIQWRER